MGKDNTEKITDEERLLENMALSAECQTRTIGVDQYLRYQSRVDKYLRPPRELD